MTRLVVQEKLLCGLFLSFFWGVFKLLMSHHVFFRDGAAYPPLLLLPPSPTTPFPLYTAFLPPDKCKVTDDGWKFQLNILRCNSMQKKRECERGGGAFPLLNSQFQGVDTGYVPGRPPTGSWDRRDGRRAHWRQSVGRPCGTHRRPNLWRLSCRHQRESERGKERVRGERMLR